MEFDFYTAETEMLEKKRSDAEAESARMANLSNIAQKLHSRSVQYAEDRNSFRSESVIENQIFLCRGNVELQITVVDNDKFSVKAHNPSPIVRQAEFSHDMNKREVMERIIVLVRDAE